MSEKVIALTIVRDGGICGRACHFLKADDFRRYGKCLLFKEALAPQHHYGDVEAWETCVDCDEIANKV